MYDMSRYPEFDFIGNLVAEECEEFNDILRYLMWETDIDEPGEQICLLFTDICEAVLKRLGWAWNKKTERYEPPEGS